MSMQAQIDAVSELARSHGPTIIAQGAAIRFLRNMMRNVIGDEFDAEAQNIIAAYDDALDDGPLKNATMDELRGLLTNE